MIKVRLALNLVINPILSLWWSVSQSIKPNHTHSSLHIPEAYCSTLVALVLWVPVTVSSLIVIIYTVIILHYSECQHIQSDAESKLRPSLLKALTQIFSYHHLQ